MGGLDCCGHNLIRHGCTAARRTRQCRLAGDCVRVHLFHRLPLLRTLYCQTGAWRRWIAPDAGLSPQRRAGLCAHQPLCALRPPFRGHRRRRPAGGPRAGRPDGLSAGNAVDPGRRGFCRSGAGHDRALPVHAARPPWLSAWRASCPRGATADRSPTWCGPRWAPSWAPSPASACC